MFDYHITYYGTYNVYKTVILCTCNILNIAIRKMSRYTVNYSTTYGIDFTFLVK